MLAVLVVVVVVWLSGVTEVVFQGPVRSGFLVFFGQDRVRSGLQKFPFWEKTEPDWEKPFYIGPVLDICQLLTG